MNFRDWFKPEEDTFQMAPLIDVVFMLLLFFIVTGALEAQEKETPIDLPKTTAAVTRTRDKLDIVVNITRDGQITIHNQLYSVPKLRQILKDIKPGAVIIRADGRAFHQDVVKVIDACAAANIRNVSFVSVNADAKEKK